MVDSRYAVNTNIALSQQGVSDDGVIVLGAADGRPAEYGWQTLRHVLGSNNPDYVQLFEDFVKSGVTVSAHYTVTSNGTGAGTTVSATEAGGVAAVAGGTDDNGFSQLATTSAWTVSNGWTYFKARFKSTVATDRGFEVGLSTAANIATDGILFSDHTAAGVTASANISTTRCVVVGGDTDSSATVLSVAAFDASTASAVDTAAAFDNEWHTVEIVVASDATTYVYVDGVLEATLTGIFQTSSKIRPYVASKSLEASQSAILFVDYIALVGERA